jgi:hydrogenase-4 component E
MLMPPPTLADLTAAPVAGLVDMLALVSLAAAVLLIATYRLATAVSFLAVQSVSLAVIAVLVAAVNGSWHIWLAAVLALIIKGMLVPRILFYVVERIRLRREVERVLPTKAALVLAAGLIILAYWVVRPLELPNSLQATNDLPVAVATVLIGGLLMVTRKKALSQIIGLLVMENGLYLAAMTFTYGMPLVVELGIFFDILIGVLVMGIITFRINQTFDTINTDHLRDLRH